MTNNSDLIDYLERQRERRATRSMFLTLGAIAAVVIVICLFAVNASNTRDQEFRDAYNESACSFDLDADGC